MHRNTVLECEDDDDDDEMQFNINDEAGRK
jgi:hypothetical protein